jgi:Protein of unknown function (DUF4239)
MVNWIYSSPTWEWGTVIVVATTVLACAGLNLFQRIVPLETRRIDNDVVGGTIAIIGISYAVLIAFIAVATWQNYTDADKSTDIEASLVANLYRDVQGLPEELTGAIRGHVIAYVDKIIHTEWPAQQRGEISRAGRDDIEAIHKVVVSFVPANSRETVVQAEFLRVVNELYTARRTRQLAAQAAIPGVIWGIILVGSLITVGYTYLFVVEKRALHMTMTGFVAASFALVIVLVIALDRPFRGDLCVSTAAYVNALESVSAQAMPSPPDTADDTR